MMEIEQVVAAADVMLADEDLWNRGAALGSLDHDVARFTAVIDGDLAIFDTPVLEQLLGSPAIGAERLGVDLNGHERSLTRRYLGKSVNASTAKVSPHAPS